MPTRILTACALAVCLTARAAEPVDDKAAIQGTWELTGRGKPAEPDVVCEKVVFKGDTLTFHYLFDGKRFTTECVFKLDAATDPKQIDFTRTEDGKKGKPYLGIYELKDGKLRLNYRGPESTRPKDFKDELAGTNVTQRMEFELERKK